MGRYKAPKDKTKAFYLPTQDYLTALHYALRYPTLLQELPPADSGGAIRYDKDKVQTSNQYDVTSELAIRRLQILEKIKIIDDTIAEVSNGLDDYVRWAVCYGFTYEQVSAKGLPLGRNQFYTMRRHFYFELIKKI